MAIRLIRIDPADAEKLWQLQKLAFRDLLEKYQDYDTNPGSEPMERVEARLAQSFTYFYYICRDDTIVGAIRVTDSMDGSRKRVSPVFILKQYRGRGYAKEAFAEIERIHGKTCWSLETILQEPANCRLYEALGYHTTGRIENIKPGMDLVYYEKD